MFDPGEEEPDEPLVEKYGEPDEDPFPEYGEPSVDEITANLPDESEVDPEFVRAFWGLVMTINLGVLAVAIGLLLVWFRGELRRGGAIAALGGITLAYAWVKYRRVRRQRRSEGPSSDGA